MSIPKPLPPTAGHYGHDPVRPIGTRFARKRRTKPKHDRSKAKRRRLLQKTSIQRNHR